MPSTLETSVWIVRHGVSTFNVEGRCQGCSDDPDLTPSGREAARLTGARLSRAGIAVVISSPLRRAVKTALAIIDAIRCQTGEVQFEIDDRLREIELPLWEGLLFQEIRNQFPAQFLSWRWHPDQMSMPSPFEESEFPVRDLYRRVSHFWKDLLIQHSGKSILLVTHSGTGRALINTALGMDERHFHGWQQSNCSISRIRCIQKHARLELLNDTAHLGDRLPKLKEGRTGTRLLLIASPQPRDEYLKALSNILAPVPIEIALSVGSEARDLATKVLQDRRHKAVEQVSEEKLLPRIRQILERSQNEIRHVAIMGHPDWLRSVLGACSGLPPKGIESLALKGGGITALHFPVAGIPPVMQAMNAFQPELSFAEVTA